MDLQRGRRRTRSIGAYYQRLRTAVTPVRDRIVSLFEVDTRALAALRVALGLIIVIDLVHRAGDLALFYTDAGVYPLSTYADTYTRYTGLSLHAASGELWFQQLMFALAGLVAVLLIVGYRTRTMGFVSLVLLFSLHARNPAVLNGADRMLRVLLLVALLTPLGERWSVDALRRGTARTRVVSFGTAAVLVQPLAVFGSNAVQKHAGVTWYQGEALQIAFANDVMTVYLGNYLVDYPALLEVLNWLWILLLSGSAVFLLLTRGRLRAAFALAYAGAFAGMLVTMMVGLFPLVLSASVVPYFTTPLWDAVARRVPAGLADRRPTEAWIGRFGRRPVERRLLDVLRERGHESAASFAVDYARSLLTVVGFVTLVWIVLFTASDVTVLEVPEEIDYTHVDQQEWGLYAPNPSDSYSWYVVEANLTDGTTVDAIDGGDVDLDRPPDASREYDTFRHRKFMRAVRSSGRGDDPGRIAQQYAAWACERANEKYGDRVERVTVHWLYQKSPVDGEYEEPRDIVLLERKCDLSRS